MVKGFSASSAKENLWFQNAWICFTDVHFVFPVSHVVNFVKLFICIQTHFLFFIIFQAHFSHYLFSFTKTYFIPRAFFGRLMFATFFPWWMSPSFRGRFGKCRSRPKGKSSRAQSEWAFFFCVVFRCFFGKDRK